MQANINEYIIKEIDEATDVSQKMKLFLKWILEFEEENSNREQFQYKKEIQYKVEELIKNA